MISIATAILRGAVCFRASADYFEIELEPCYRDYLNAQFDGPVGPDWRPVVDATETIPNCPLPGI